MAQQNKILRSIRSDSAIGKLDFLYNSDNEEVRSLRKLDEAFFVRDVTHISQACGIVGHYVEERIGKIRLQETYQAEVVLFRRNPGEVDSLRNNNVKLNSLCKSFSGTYQVGLDSFLSLAGDSTLEEQDFLCMSDIGGLKSLRKLCEAMFGRSVRDVSQVRWIVEHYVMERIDELSAPATARP